jgi:hypothetical protein
MRGASENESKQNKSFELPVGLERSSFGNISLTLPLISKGQHPSD